MWYLFLVALGVLVIIARVAGVTGIGLDCTAGDVVTEVHPVVGVVAIVVTSPLTGVSLPMQGGHWTFPSSSFPFPSSSSSSPPPHHIILVLALVLIIILALVLDVTKKALIPLAKPWIQLIY